MPGKGEVCVTHPDTPSTGRCHSCHRPLCDQCKVESEDGIFCSNKCKVQFVNFRGKHGPPKQENKLVATVKKLVILVIVLALCYAAYAHRHWLLGKAGELKKDAEKAGAGVVEDTEKSLGNRIGRE